MTTVACDRCGNEVRRPGKPRANYALTNGSSDGSLISAARQEFDLCLSCAILLGDWLAEMHKRGMAKGWSDPEDPE